MARSIPRQRGQQEQEAYRSGALAGKARAQLCPTERSVSQEKSADIHASMKALGLTRNGERSKFIEGYASSWCHERWGI